MPVEIKELIIRATVGDDARATEATSPAQNRLRPGLASRALPQAELDKIVETCVKRVLRILKKAQER
jgi:hypothetical protein